MKWHTLGTFAFLVGIVSCQSMETQDHAPSVDKTFHFPTASLTIAGDLKDVKLKGTIAQLVRALQQPNSSKPKEAPEPKPKTAGGGKKKIIHPSQLITKHTLNKNGKRLDFGEVLPETITVSSQSVKVNQANATGGKKSRHLGAFISNHPSAVKTVEGVRVPDDEHDKHYTYRNARVIKNFLVPNGRPANPHKKRQVIITDPQQYLAAAAAAQAQGATTIIDTSQLQRSANGNNGQPRTSVFYAQEQALQGAGSASGGMMSNNEHSQQRSHQHAHVNYQNQQQQQQHHHQTANNGQTGSFSYAQQNPHSMYVLQDGNSNSNNGFNNLKYSNNNQASTHQQQQTQYQAQLAQQQAQAQFFSRSGEAPIAPVSSGSNNNPIALSQSQQQQHGSVPESAVHQQQQQTLSAAIKQQQYQSSSLDTSAIQAAVEAVQQLEAQQQAQAAAQAAGGHQQQQQHQILSADQQQHHHQHQGILGIQQGQEQQIAALLAQQSAPQQTVVLPQSVLSAGGATAQEILAATQAATNGQVTAQYISLQPSQEQQLLQLQQSGQTQQFPAPDQFSERQYQGGAAYPASATQFVIQPQTYVTGAGGQAFTVPIPVPVEQAVQQATQQVVQQQQQHQQQQQARLHHGGNSQQYNNNNNYQQQHQQQQYQQQQQQYLGGPNNNNRQNHQQQNHHQNHHQGQNPNQPSTMDKVKHAFSQNFNRKMLERVETNAVVPALASTGLFLGLSALAAGWYLSKSNREVGIVRRTGKFSKKKGALPTQPPAVEGEADIENTPNTRTRRDLASMMTHGHGPQSYTPGGAPEVDQATFFQSIIQQSLEKTQKEYDDEPVYQQNQDNMGGGAPGGQYNNNDGPIGYHRGEPEPDRRAPPPPPPPQSRLRSKFNRYSERPSKYTSRDDDFYDSPANSRISKTQAIQEKSGWSVHSAKNFARVAIPAIVLTGAALGICAVIFGWYISGDNREIAFLESPTTNSIGGNLHSRKKRSLFGPATWSDGWLIRTLKAIHGNPYDNMPAPTAKSFVPYPYFLDKASSKTSTLEFKVSNNGLRGVLAGGAVLAVVALGLINSFSESSGRNLKTARYNRLLTGAGQGGAKSSTNPLTHLRSPRTMMAGFDNNLEYQQSLSSPSFFESIVSSLEASGDTIMNKLHELGASNSWQQSSCTKRVLCQVITSQGDDTVRLMEKKMAAVMKMLPDSVSSSINKNYSDVLSAIYKRDCSAFTCSTQKPHKEESVQTIKSKPRRSSTSTVSSHHQQKKGKSSINIEQTNAHR